MAKETVEQEDALKRRMAEEEEIREKVDEDGTRWIKVYFGGGTHFKNWLSQSVELKGEGNVKVEEVDSTGFQCYEESGEKMYRIWVKDTVCPGDVCVPDPGHKESKQQLLEKWHSLHPGETPVFEPKRHKL